MDVNGLSPLSLSPTASACYPLSAIVNLGMSIMAKTSSLFWKYHFDCFPPASSFLFCSISCMLAFSSFRYLHVTIGDYNKHQHTNYERNKEIDKVTREDRVRLIA